MPFPRTTPFHWCIVNCVTLSAIFTGCQAFLVKKVALIEIKQEIASSLRQGVSPSFPPLAGGIEGGGKMTFPLI